MRENKGSGKRSLPHLHIQELKSQEMRKSVTLQNPASWPLAE